MKIGPTASDRVGGRMGGGRPGQSNASQTGKRSIPSRLKAITVIISIYPCFYASEPSQPWSRRHSFSPSLSGGFALRCPPGAGR